MQDVAGRLILGGVAVGIDVGRAMTVDDTAEGGVAGEVEDLVATTEENVGCAKVGRGNVRGLLGRGLCFGIGCRFGLVCLRHDAVMRCNVNSFDWI